MTYQLPRGTEDLYGQRLFSWQQLEQTLRNFCSLYHYEEIRTPIFEHTNVFKRENDSSDMVNKEMYTFTVAGSKTSLTLRPEGTAGVVRSYVEQKLYANPDLPIKVFYMGPMARHERPQKGRLRLFHQFGVEALGAKDPYIDAESILLAYSLLKGLGLNNMTVHLNTLGDDESRRAYRAALKEHFATHVADLCQDCQRRYEQNPLRMLDCKVDHDHPAIQNAPVMADYLNDESKAYFETVKALLDEVEVPYVVDDHLVRGLDYYTHTVFEIIMDSENMGAQTTVLAGGRYDGLIEYFGGPQQSGIGWALGMERLLIALQAEGVAQEEKPGLDTYVMVLDEKVRMQAFALLTELRAFGFSSEMDFQKRSMKSQFKAVDRSQARFVILLGQKEIDQKGVTIKDTQTRQQEWVPLDQLIAYLDHHLEMEEHEHASHD